MKFGIRKPSLKRSIKAKTTGKMKRKVKSSINPTYGKKGMGWIKNPKKASYNKVYNKTTTSAIPKGSTRKSNENTDSEYSASGCLLALIWMISFVLILFNGKTLVHKFFSFIAIVFISTIIVTVIGNKLNLSNYNKTSITNRIDDEEYEFYASQATSYVRQINDSIKIINTTKNPDTFFQRYNLTLERLDQLIEISKKVSYSGEDPEEYLEEFNQNKVSTFDDFINRYYEDVNSKITNLKTEKAKINNANKFYENVIKYKEQLKPENIETITMLHTKLKESINK